jgi:Zn-dependent M28 family amino/carboxypeptidase
MKKYLIALLSLFFLISCTSRSGSPTSIPTQSPTSTPQSTSVPEQPAPTNTDAPDQTELPAAGMIALAHMDYISNEIGPRPAGTAQEAATAQYIVRVFERLRYPSQVQSFIVDGKTSESTNVIAIKHGTSMKEIIVGAHYDSVKTGRGADDNASGVAVILEVAERLRDIEIPYTIRFILFGAEEAGLQGSKSYVMEMSPEQIQNTIAMINLDSVAAGDFAYVYGDKGELGSIRDWALQFASDNDLVLQTQSGENPKYPAGTTGDWSDHAPFKDAGIPYAYFESTNWTLGNKDGYTQVDPQYGKNGEIWHTSHDTLDYINKIFPGRIQERLHLFVTVLQGVLTEYQEQ